MKKLYNITNFSGGINNNTNPRDIADNQFKVLQGLDNEIPGKLKLFGSVIDEDSSTYTESHNNTTPYGNGLFHLNLDRDIPNGTLGATELYIINDYVNKNVDFYNPADNSVESAEITYGGSSSSGINAYVIDGQIRISPTNFAVTDSKCMWYGYIDKTYNLGNDSLTPGDGVSDTTDQIAKSYDSYFPTDLHLAPLNTSNGYSYDPDSFGEGDVSTITNTTSEIILNDGLTYPDDVSASLIDSGGLHTKAGLHTQLNKQTSNMSEGYGHFGIYAWFHENTNAENQGQSEITVYGRNITYALFASNVYDDQESAPVYLGDVKQPNFFLSIQNWNRPLHFLITGRLPNKPRQTGINIYWALNTNGSFGQKYLFAEVNFEKGLRYGGETAYTEFSTFNSTRQYYVFPVAAAATYSYGDVRNTLSQNEPYLNDTQSLIGRPGSAFKTSTIANRRAYIGNVAYYEKGERVIKADTVLKSKVNAFDVFSKEDFIDVEINDGDEIIKLESLGNRILQFKKKNLFIINVSRDIEFLESTFEFRGCNKDYHVVKGEGFIAWFNKHSMFLYNGESVVDLNLDENGQDRLANWGNDYYHDDSIIGYFPDKKSIYIFNSNDNKILQFDIKSQSFSNVDVTVDSKLSNAVNNNAGELVFFRNNGTNNKLQKYSDTAVLLPVADDEVLLQTKDIDFGTPDVNKNINTIYLNYKYDYNSDRLQLRGIADNGSPIDLEDLPEHTTFGTAKISVTNSSFKNIKSFALQIASNGTNSINPSFELNDIQIVYREKVRR